MYVQNAANGHPGLPACGRGASSPTTSAPPPAGAGTRRATCCR